MFQSSLKRHFTAPAAGSRAILNNLISQQKKRQPSDWQSLENEKCNCDSGEPLDMCCSVALRVFSYTIFCLKEFVREGYERGEPAADSDSAFAHDRLHPFTKHPQ